MGNEDEPIRLMDAVREMIWNSTEVRQAYEVLRTRGISGDEAVTEIARGYLWCLWEGTKNKPQRWPDVLREIRRGRAVSDLFRDSRYRTRMQPANASSPKARKHDLFAPLQRQ